MVMMPGVLLKANGGHRRADREKDRPFLTPKLGTSQRRGRGSACSEAHLPASFPRRALLPVLQVLSVDHPAENRAELPATPSDKQAALSSRKSVLGHPHMLPCTRTLRRAHCEGVHTGVEGVGGGG